MYDVSTATGMCYYISSESWMFRVHWKLYPLKTISLFEKAMVKSLNKFNRAYGSVRYDRNGEREHIRAEVAKRSC